MASLGLELVIESARGRSSCSSLCSVPRKSSAQNPAHTEFEGAGFLSSPNMRISAYVMGS